MRVAFIGDIVGRPGRAMVKAHLSHLRQKYELDTIIANVENASHGFGITTKNANELFACGVDVMTGGNHIFDKRDIFPLMDTMPILRPINYPSGASGRGEYIATVKGEALVVINAMGIFAMPHTSNPFILLRDRVQALHKEGYRNIFIDFHAEATSEKRALLMLLRGQVSAIVGTHTHIGTDDLEICQGSAYVTDVGLCGCWNNIIGLDEKEPIRRFLTGMPIKYEINNQCKKVLQMIVMDFDEGKCTEAFKVKVFDDAEDAVTMRAIV